MKHTIAIVVFISGLIMAGAAGAQDKIPVATQYRLVEGIVQISKPGEESVLVNLWGDVNAPGLFMIPAGTTLIELISYARGPVSYRTGETTLERSKLRVEVNISRRNRELNIDEVANFKFIIRSNCRPEYAISFCKKVISSLLK